ncbi:MAG TPA: universal stress protein [Candidatus Eremiobacteraceae bacterium]|nr:universal stress protein [Candidatus Eremiobacteraceae bacterium]
MFANIVVPIDGSEPAAAAIDLALRMVKEQRAALSFIYVLEIEKLAIATVPVSMNPELIFDEARKAAEEILTGAKARAKKAGVEADVRLLEGDCVDSVLQFARDNKSELIVIGSHGRTGITRALLGSVAEGIIRRAPVPVLVTHPPQAAP